jgi:phthiodiolone/phenolphthiodiolone dimycocerosates ketoreductase
MGVTSSKAAEVAAIVWGDRNYPAGAVMDEAKALAACGAVDAIHMSDQLVNLIPPQLWKPEHTGMAKTIADPDSHPDPFVMGAVAHVAAPGIGLSIATDSVRHGPAELMQTMLTLANLTEGRATFHIGAGEVKQCSAFGWNRNQGVGRLEEMLHLFQKFWDTDGPISFDGKYTKFDRAYLGCAKPHRPKIWGLGGGPKLLDLTLACADGMAATAPNLWETPEHAHKDISAMKQVLEAKGRDPEAFGFGIYCSVFVHDDEEVIDKFLDNAIAKWLAGILGRVVPTDWRNEGIEPVVPDGWTYFKDMYPHNQSDAFVADVVRKTTREMVKKGWIYGTPEQVGERLRQYADAGVTWILPCDWSPLMLDAEDVAANQLRRNIGIFKTIKGMA